MLYRRGAKIQAISQLRRGMSRKYRQQSDTTKIRTGLGTWSQFRGFFFIGKIWDSISRHSFSIFSKVIFQRKIPT
jgi:hypothetical protein